MRHSTCPRGLVWAFALITPLVLGCDPTTSAAPPADASRFPDEPHAALGADGELHDAVLLVGNLVPGLPAGNGAFLFDDGGGLITHLAQGGCCATFGPDEHIYLIRQFGLHRFHPVTGEFIDVFIAPGSGGLQAPLVSLVGPDGNFYVGDRLSHSIRRYDGRTGAPIGDDPEFVKGHQQGLGMGDPQFFVFGLDGHLYVTSIDTDRILRYDGRTGAFIDEFVSAGEGGLDRPSGIVFGPDGHLYVGSTTTDRIIRYHGTTGEVIDDFVREGSGGLDEPVGITFGPDGNLYVASAARPESASVLRYDGRTGEFIDAFVPVGGGATGPRSIQFKTHLTICHRAPGNASSAQTIRIGYLSSFDHVAHGDEIGACA